MVTTMIKKIGLLLALTAFLFLLVYLVFQRGKTVEREIVPTLNSEFGIVLENKDYFISKIKEQIKSADKKDIDSRSCKGFLYDGDKDGYYDKPIFNKKIQSLNKSLIAKYNFCSYYKTKENNFLLMITTDKLVNNFMKKELGEDYVPTIILNVSKNGSNIEKGLVPADILLEGL